MATWYAWTDIAYSEGDEKDTVRKVAKAGSEVFKDSLNVDDEEFVQLVEARAVRQQKYPDLPATWESSPNEFVLMRAKADLAAMEANVDLDAALAAAESDREAAFTAEGDNVVSEDETEVE